MIRVSRTNLMKSNGVTPFPTWQEQQRFGLIKTSTAFSSEAIMIAVNKQLNRTDCLGERGR
jgi:hypothetical protein